MEITYLGHSAFKIKTKTASVITDPFDPKITGIKFAGIEGEIVTLSHDHPDHNASDKVIGVKKIVDGPGEYEIMGVSMIGYSSFHDTNNGADRGKNTIYVYEFEGLRLAHLGDLGHELSDDLVSELGDIDVLMIPVGGEYTIGPKEASQIVSKIEPFFVIPMHYAMPGLAPDLAGKLAPLETFLKESGLPHESMSKFVLKKEDITDEQRTKVIVLEKK